MWSICFLLQIMSGNHQGRRKEFVIVIVGPPTQNRFFLHNNETLDELWWHSNFERMHLIDNMVHYYAIPQDGWYTHTTTYMNGENQMIANMYVGIRILHSRWIAFFSRSTLLEFIFNIHTEQKMAHSGAVFFCVSISTNSTT